MLLPVPVVLSTALKRPVKISKIPVELIYQELGYVVLGNGNLAHLIVACLHKLSQDPEVSTSERQHRIKRHESLNKTAKNAGH